MPSKWEMALHALTLLMEPMRLSFLVGGVLLGLAVGAIPGLGGLVALAVLIPLTYGMDAYTAFALLLGVAAVTATSDLIPAVLFGVPGSVGASATVLDGHPMARRGEAGRAFGAGFMASLCGGLFGALVLALSIPVLQPLMLAVGSPELLAFSIFGLSMVATLSGRFPLRGLAAASAGLMLSLVGAGTQTGELRWTFEWLYLFEGLPLVPVTLGLFAVPELADLAINRRRIGGEHLAGITFSSQWQGVRDVIRHWWLAMRCSAIGTLLGVLPGIGAAVIDWIVYGYAIRTEKHPGQFGAGDVRGVIAPESANNAKEGGQLIPTIAFGVPAGASMTLLLSAFLIHGLTPGPDMLSANLDVTYLIVWSLTLAQVLASAICIWGTSWLVKLAQVRYEILLPLILPVVFVAAFQGTSDWGDLYVVVTVGVLGWIMKALDWPRPPLVLGFVLGEIFERYFFLSTQVYGPTAWMTRPIVLGVAVLVAWALYRPLGETARRLWREFRHLRGAHCRFTSSAALSVGVMTLAVIGLVTSADWQPVEQIVPRVACWSTLMFATLSLTADVFGAQAGVLVTASERAASHAEPVVGGEVLRRRAMEYFLWLGGFVGCIALVGFIPAIGLFVFLYMRIGFRQPAGSAAAYATGTAVFCWTVFHKGLAMAWPLSLLGDWYPDLRVATGFL